MCGVVGIVSNEDVNQELFDALTALQHRGQDAAGIATCTPDGRLHLHKDRGLVRDVFRTRHMYMLKGQMGIGHVRYPTAGTESHLESQPFYVNTPYGLSLVHNGTLTNATVLRQSLWQSDLRHVNTDSDTELLINVFAHELRHRHQKQLTTEQIFAAVNAVHQRCQGAYAVVAMLNSYGLVAFRDPNAIRPLIIGRRKTAAGIRYMVASESAALVTLDYEIIDDVAPGEAVIITQTGELYRQQCADETHYSPCVFEYVYLSRPDSVVDKISVYKVRVHLGQCLAERILKLKPDLKVDVVMPIPDTARPAAFELSLRLGVKYREGFVKNRYIGRTFIMPGQSARQRSVRRKLNTLDLEFQDKNVLLVDDSIVRGTTSKGIIDMARKAGAKQVYFASAAPQVRYPNVYGIDMPAAQELIAHGRDDEEICREIGADWLVFQALSDLIRCAQAGNPSITRFEDSIFTGNYITGDVDDAFFKALAKSRGESKTY